MELSTSLKYRVLAALSVSLSALSIAAAAQAAESFDPSFGEGGISFPGHGGDIRSLAQDAEGRIISGGGVEAGIRVARYLADGAPDLDFGGGDGRTFPGSFGLQANAVAVQPDGKILAAGSTESGNFTLVRYEADGSRRDPDFGTAREGGYTLTTAGFYGGGAQAMALQPSGRILLAGYGIDYHHEWTAMVAAYRHNGTLERRFSGDGKASLTPTGGGEVPIRLIAVKALPSGKILAAGDIGGRLMVVRYRPNGRPDRSFGGGDGILYTDVDGSRRCACAYATDMEVDRRGRIVVSANVTGPGKRQPAALIRYRPNGRLDRNFGRGGISRALLGSRLAGKALAIDHRGRIVLAGTYNVAETGEARVAVARFLPNGRLDRSFARSGFFIRDFGHEGVAYAALTQRDGRVVIGGRANREPSPFPEDPSVYDTAQVFLIRFLP